MEGDQRRKMRVRVAPLGDFKVWLVHEQELDTLAAGASGGILLNFALALLPVSVTLFLTLITVEIASLRVFTVFVSLCAISFISGIICLTLGLRSFQDTAKLVAQIKRPMPADGERQRRIPSDSG